MASLAASYATSKVSSLAADELLGPLIDPFAPRRSRVTAGSLSSSAPAGAPETAAAAARRGVCVCVCV